MCEPSSTQLKIYEYNVYRGYSVTLTIINRLKKNLKRLKKHLHVQMDSSTLLRKELAEQAATARTLELDLQAQRDVSLLGEGAVLSH